MIFIFDVGLTDTTNTNAVFNFSMFAMLGQHAPAAAVASVPVLLARAVVGGIEGSALWCLKVVCCIIQIDKADEPSGPKSF